MVILTDDESNVLAMLTGQTQQTSDILKKQLAARKSYINLLENKYDAVFNETTGIFSSKVESKE